jgi:hypothetical protein
MQDIQSDQNSPNPWKSKNWIWFAGPQQKPDNEVEKILNTHRAQSEPERKVVIFSEYTDTVRHLVPILEKAFGGKIINSTSGLMIFPPNAIKGNIC